MKNKNKIILFVIAITIALISFILINEVQKPKYNYTPDVNEQTIEYKGRVYYPIGDSKLYEYKNGKALKRTMFGGIYTIENDKDTNFLVYSEWHYHEMFTCIKDYSKKYPYGVCDNDRVTSILLRNTSATKSFNSTTPELNDILLNPENYTDFEKAKFPLKNSAGFTIRIYAFMDNMPLSNCYLGELAYYDGKWIFVDNETQFEGNSNKYGDTRTFTGIVINNPEAVKILDEYSSKHFEYMINN